MGDRLVANKSLQQLIDLAKVQGWRVEKTNGQHVKWFSPDPQYANTPVLTSSTPGDENIIRTIKRDLKAQGFVDDKQEAKKIGKAVRRGDGIQIGDHVVVTTEDERAWLKPTKPLAEWSDDEVLAGISNVNQGRYQVDKLTRRQRKALAEMFRRAGDVDADVAWWPKECHTCGIHYEDSFDLAYHLVEFRQHEPERNNPTKEEEMAIAEREKINCPFCPGWFWINEPFRLDVHVDEEHNKRKCGVCGKWLPTNGLAQHVAQVHPSSYEAFTQTPDSGVSLEEPKRILDLTPLDKHVNEPNLALCAGGCRRPIAYSKTIYCLECQRALDDAAAEDALARIVVPPKPDAVDPPPPPIPTPPVALPAPVQAAAASVGGSAGHTDPIQPAPIQSPKRPPRKADISDDELFALLELVLDGPVMITKESFAALNQWMDATRKLLKVKYGS